MTAENNVGVRLRVTTERVGAWLKGKDCGGVAEEWKQSGGGVQKRCLNALLLHSQAECAPSIAPRTRNISGPPVPTKRKTIPVRSLPSSVPSEHAFPSRLAVPTTPPELHPRTSATSPLPPLPPKSPELSRPVVSRVVLTTELLSMDVWCFVASGVASIVKVTITSLIHEMFSVLIFSTQQDATDVVGRIHDSAPRIN